jgi:type IX secretion system PorP/SprF family membrane protein
LSNIYLITMKKSKMVLMGFAMLGLSGLHAQDPHFSQYFSSPMTLNPALTGKGVDDYRVMVNTRSQWWGGGIKPYYTFTGSIEKTFAGAGDAGYGAVGFVALSDQSNGGLLKNNYYGLSAAYHISLDAQKEHQLSAGLTATYTNRLLDAGKFKFQSQLGDMGFQRDIPSGDPVSIMKANYVDFHAGLYYSFNAARYGWQAGGAMFHAGTPQEGVYDNSSYKIPRRFSFQAGGWSRVGDANSLHLSAVLDKQGENNIFTLAGIYKLAVGDDLLKTVNLGIGERFGDALYPYFGLETDRWLGAITYDVVHAGVTNYQSVQSLELSLVFKLGRLRSRPGASSGMLIY